MTREQFLTEIRDLLDFKPALTEYNAIRLTRNGNKRIFDPITALTYKKTGQYFPLEKVHDAADTICLEDHRSFVVAIDRIVSDQHALFHLRTTLIKIFAL